MGAPSALAIAKIPCTVDNGSFLSLFLQCSVVHQTYKHTSHFSFALFVACQDVTLYYTTLPLLNETLRIPMNGVACVTLYAL